MKTNNTPTLKNIDAIIEKIKFEAETNNPNYSLNFVVYQDCVLKSKNPEQILKFAKLVPCANISRLENAIIKCCDIDAIINFANEVPGANLEKLWAAYQQLSKSASNKSME